jgi:hypothetical protein
VIQNSFIYVFSSQLGIENLSLSGSGVGVRAAASSTLHLVRCHLNDFDTGVYCEAYSQTFLEDCLIESHTALGRFGAIAAVFSHITLRDDHRFPDYDPENLIKNEISNYGRALFATHYSIISSHTQGLTVSNVPNPNVTELGGLIDIR